MRIRRDIRFADLTTLRVGGPSRCLIDATSQQEIVDAVLDCDDRREPLLILGGGSNLVVSDTGFPGTVVRVGNRGIDTQRTDDTVELTVQAGALGRGRRADRTRWAHWVRVHPASPA